MFPLDVPKFGLCMNSEMSIFTYLPFSAVFSCGAVNDPMSFFSLVLLLLIARFLWILSSRFFSWFYSSFFILSYCFYPLCLLSSISFLATICDWFWAFFNSSSFFSFLINIEPVFPFMISAIAGFDKNPCSRFWYSKYLGEPRY